MKKAIVVYYSYEGSTEKVAKLIAKTIGVEAHAIKPVKEMKYKGFLKFFIGGMNVVLGKKPKIQPIDIDFNKYDLIFLGSPIWAGTFAPPIKTFIDSNILANKKIAYFYCNEGGAKNASEKAKPSIEKNNKLIATLDCANVIKNWNTLSKSIIKWAQDITK